MNPDRKQPAQSSFNRKKPKEEQVSPRDYSYMSQDQVL